MFRKLVSSVAALSIVATSFAPAMASDISGADGTFFYRYKTTMPRIDNPDQEEKDVVAYYVGGVGFDFSEVLPLKTEWQDDNWKVTSGTLPAGITFNSATRTFEGKPSAAAAGTVVYLVGTDLNGNEVADAKVTFDVYDIVGAPVHTNIYAHTGKYKLEELTIPSGIKVDTWERVSKYSPPPGVTVNGPYFEGTPTVAGSWNYMIYGKNYMGETVVTFWGTYVVEDRPTFPLIADMVFPLPQSETGPLGPFDFGAPTPYKINQPIDPSKAVRYFLETDPTKSDGLPGNVVSNDNAKSLNLFGRVYEPYDTATVRFRAVDSDGVEGWSNWFTFGSSDPQPGCAPGSESLPLAVKTGKVSNISIPRPYGSDGLLEFSVKSGTLPSGLSLDKESGAIVGTPLIAGESQVIAFQVDVINGTNSVSTTCTYRINVQAGGVGIADLTDPQARHVRTGDVYTGVASISGGIPNYNLSFSDPSALPLIFTTPTANADTVGISGVIPTAGTHSIGLTLANGDGNPTSGQLSVVAHDELDVKTVPTVHIKRFAPSILWGSIPYDAATVIPDVKLGNQPKFSLSNVGGLPSDIKFSEDGEFTGLTKAEAKSYGMFTATMSDYSGDTVTTDPFEVVVDPRDPIAINTVIPVAFRVEDPRAQSLVPISIKQPWGAVDLKVSWTLNNVNGITLPSWLHFDQEKGEFSVDAQIPYADLKNYGPFTLTATDEDESSVTSDEFYVQITDWDPPSGQVMSQYRGSVSGDTSAGETNTFMTIPSLRPSIFDNTVIGGRDGVTFLSSDPANPAGLDFYVADGSFSGVPTSEFKGDVTVRFKDTRGREGELLVPLEVRAYPTVRMGQSEYTVPRLSNAAALNPSIAGQPINGFWAAPEWSLDTSAGHPNLPAGLTVDLSGKVVGKTTAAVGTKVSNLRLKAISSGTKGEPLVSFTQPFDLTVGTPVKFTLDYSPATAKFLLRENVGGGYDFVQPHPSTAPVLGGSFVNPLIYTMNKADAVANGMTGTLDVNTANGNLSGYPDKPGRWNVTVNAVDNEGVPVEAPATIDVWSTLAGFVELADGNGGGSAGGNLTLRLGEPFKTSPISVKNNVGSVIFSTSPAALPSSLAAGFSATDGSFSDESYLDFVTNSYSVLLQATDRDDRTFNTPLPQLTFKVIPPLEASISASETLIETRQYSADESDAIDASFNVSLKYAMGVIRYSLIGDVPGTLVNKVYDLDGNFIGYSWTDEDEIAHDLPASTPTKDLPNLLPLDALVFDTMTPSLKGIPSKEGNFTVKIRAFDHHADDYIKNVASKVENNSALTAPITIAVKPANPLEVANTADSETVYQYTTSPTLRVLATNAAYGRSVTWTAVGTTNLPQNVAVSKAAYQLGYGGYPEQTGTFGNLVWTAKDAAGRSGTSNPATIKVEPRKALDLIASEDPVARLVNVSDVDLKITPFNSAYGRAIPDDKWSVTGADRLPPGVTYKIENNSVTFSGIPTVTGTYEGISVTAVDSLGSTKTIQVKIVVLEPTDEINLSVSNITTKKNVPFQMQASATNTYGKVQFYSYDIDGDPRTHVMGQYADSLDIDVNTGLVSGSFATVGDRDFDVLVTDTTKRVTSKPVSVSVIPDLRLTVPTLVQSQQAVKLDRAIDTTYALGTVAYEKGAGDWPIGVEVDPTSGAIRSKFVDSISGEVSDKMQAASGTYDGLTIVGVDTYQVSGVTYTDRQSSNVFSIFVDMADLLPVITTPAKTILGVKGTEIASWRPVVKDDVEGKTWNYAGTKYKLSSDLTQYGLSFDEDTGVISGTAHTAFIVRDLVITVTSQRGDISKTSPFWIGVAPDGDITAPADQSIVVRIGDAVPPTVPVFNNTLGTLTYAKTSGNSGIGVDTNLGSIVAINPTSIWVEGDYPIGYKLTDEFGRTGTTTVIVKARNKFTLDAGNLKIVPGDVAGRVLATAKNATGNVSYTITGLPNYLVSQGGNPVVSGTIPSSEIGKSYSVTITAVDGDGSSATTTITLAIRAASPACIDPVQSFDAGAKTNWSIGMFGNVANQRLMGGTGNGLMRTAEIKFFDENGDCYKPVSLYDYYNNSTTSLVNDNNPDTYHDSQGGGAVVAYFGVNVKIVAAEITMTGTPQDLAITYACKGNNGGWAYGSYFQECGTPKQALKALNGQNYAKGDIVTFTFPTTWTNSPATVTQSPYTAP